MAFSIPDRTPILSMIGFSVCAGMYLIIPLAPTPKHCIPQEGSCWSVTTLWCAEQFLLYKVPSKESNYCDLFYFPKGPTALCSKNLVVLHPLPASVFTKLAPLQTFNF